VKVGDLVRYRQGSLDKVGIITGQKEDGDYIVKFVQRSCLGAVSTPAVPCRWRNLEVISESR